MLKKRRVFGDKIDFASLSCAPVNELGVVYLFGVLHKSFDYRIESIQAGYPDCIARRKIGRNRWEEVRIEFEFNSKSFVSHGHDPSSVDVIICWIHDWMNCPDDIEFIELKSVLDDIKIIDSSLNRMTKLNEWQLFCQEKRLQGMDFSVIAKEYRKYKALRE